MHTEFCDIGLVEIPNGAATGDKLEIGEHATVKCSEGFLEETDNNQTQQVGIYD